MAEPTADSVSRNLHSLFDAERTLRRVHADLVKAHTKDPEPLVTALRAEVKGARQEPPEEQAIRLVRVASLLGDLHGANAVDLLIELLDADDPEPRHAAGEALEGLAYDRFKEVALGIERALTRLPAGSAALTELPYLLAEIPEPGAAKLLGRFLQHKDPEAVAAAIEALVEIADPSAATMLAPLTSDKRVVQLEDEGGEEGKVTLGELATEARQLLAEMSHAEAKPERAEKR